MNVELRAFLDRVASVIECNRYPIVSEHVLHDALESVLRAAMPEVEMLRELRIGAADRFDLWFPALRTALEVKIDVSLSQLTRQLHRYASRTDVDALIVVTTKVRHALSIPNEMAGKPVRVIALTGSLV